MWIRWYSVTYNGMTKWHKIGGNDPSERTVCAQPILVRTEVTSDPPADQIRCKRCLSVKDLTSPAPATNV